MEPVLVKISQYARATKTLSCKAIYAFYGRGKSSVVSGYHGSSYEQLDGSLLIGEMLLCFHQTRSNRHISSLQEERSIHTYATTCLILPSFPCLLKSLQLCPEPIVQDSLKLKNLQTFLKICETTCRISLKSR